LREKNVLVSMQVVHTVQIQIHVRRWRIRSARARRTCKLKAHNARSEPKQVSQENMFCVFTRVTQELPIGIAGICHVKYLSKISKVW